MRVKCLGIARGRVGGWAVLELTGTLFLVSVGQQFNNLQQAALLTSLANMTKFFPTLVNSSWLC